MSEKKIVGELIRELVKHHSVSIHLSDDSTTINQNLAKAGINRERLISFLSRNIDHNREILELRKDSMPNEEYYKEKLELNEVDIFILYLENSL